MGGNVETARRETAAATRSSSIGRADKSARQWARNALLSGRSRGAVLHRQRPWIRLAEADGVHRPGRPPPEKVRQLVGEEMIIGPSTHSPRKRGRMESPISSTTLASARSSRLPRKDVCEPVGLEYLDTFPQYQPAVRSHRRHQRNKYRPCATGAGLSRW